MLPAVMEVTPELVHCACRLRRNSARLAGRDCGWMDGDVETASQDSDIAVSRMRMSRCTSSLQLPRLSRRSEAMLMTKS